MSDPNDDDMDKSVTKREFREAIDKLVTKREFREAVTTELVTKTELNDLMVKLFAYLDDRFAAIDKRFDSFATKEWFSAELARHSGAVDDRHRTELGVIDDKFRDLPERVAKLEAAVFPAPPAKRQRRR